ncbi:hypothetical protein SESBI_50780 [Sesbania bispinosa]|nr:hypothetical protein SESBI_50780 [Sesbania bispinosa]
MTGGLVLLEKLGLLEDLTARGPGEDVVAEREKRGCCRWRYRIRGTPLPTEGFICGVWKRSTISDASSFPLKEEELHSLPTDGGGRSDIDILVTRGHGPKQVIAIDALALLPLTRVEGLTGDEAHELALPARCLNPPLRLKLCWNSNRFTTN